jgi:hypothetical protein
MHTFAETINAISNAIGISGRTFLTTLACTFIICGLIVFFFFKGEEAKNKKWAVIVIVFLALIVDGLGFAATANLRQTPATSPSAHPTLPAPPVTSPLTSSTPNSSQSSNTAKRTLRSKPLQPTTGPDLKPEPETVPNVPPGTCIAIGGICAPGGTVDHPTINNNYSQPAPPQIAVREDVTHVLRESPNTLIYIQKHLPIPPPTEAFQINLAVSLLSQFANPSFIIRCDRPCYRVYTQIPGLNSFGDQQGSGADFDLIVDITSPRVLRAGMQVLFGVQANSGEAFTIRDVKPNI